jgi:carbamoyltransferase
MILWGINALNHGSSLAVFKDNKLVMFETGKADDLDQTLQLDAISKYGKPDRVFWYERPWVKKARQLYARQYNTAFDLNSVPRIKLSNWGLRYTPITYTPHHASHAAAGYYTSPFNHCAIVVLDAIGEFECATIWEAHHGEMKKLWSRSYPHSLGLFYSAYTQYVGLTPIRDEHIFQQMAEQGNGYLWLNSVRKHFNEGALNLKTNFHRGLYWEDNQLTSLQEQCDLAAAVQQVFEEQVALIMQKAKDLTGSDCLVYMGGCAMNSKTNKSVVEPMFKYRWSLPNPGDPSSSIGAVLYHTKQRVWDYKWDLVKHLEIKI